MLSDPQRPFVAILGGSKVSDKFGVIDRLLDICDTLVIGGGMCFTFLVAKDVAVGKSLVEQDWVEPAKQMLEKAKERGVELMLPVDFVVAPEIAEDAETRIVGREEIPPEMMGLDIGPTAIELYKGAISDAKTIFWNGPMGVFELKPFEAGTREVAMAVARNNRAVSIIGGGDSVAALKKFDLEERVTFVSTGGGASMKLLEGAQLPGVEALEKKQ
jgi:phosphoglycerate kinase